MFDPFGDFADRGYLRNINGATDLDEVKVLEHNFFEAHLEEALAFLSSIEGDIGYAHFCRVHRILFGEFYPWAGTDRHALGVGRLITKGPEDDFVQFEVSELCGQAIEWGLGMGNHVETMRSKPGTVMGAFAWAHPFLDGNGRTMLLVHAELAHRAGFSIDWAKSRKEDYLAALTREIRQPDQRPRGHLDSYLASLVVPSSSISTLADSLSAIPGLDGRFSVNVPETAYAAHDPDAERRYREAKHARGE
jgi:cell filamentation protein